MRFGNLKLALRPFDLLSRGGLAVGVAALALSAASPADASNFSFGLGYSTGGYSGDRFSFGLGYGGGYGYGWHHPYYGGYYRPFYAPTYYSQTYLTVPVVVASPAYSVDTGGSWVYENGSYLWRPYADGALSSIAVPSNSTTYQYDNDGDGDIDTTIINTAPVTYFPATTIIAYDAYPYAFSPFYQPYCGFGFGSGFGGYHHFSPWHHRYYNDFAFSSGYYGSGLTLGFNFNFGGHHDHWNNYGYGRGNYNNSFNTYNTYNTYNNNGPVTTTNTVARGAGRDAFAARNAERNARGNSAAQITNAGALSTGNLAAKPDAAPRDRVVKSPSNQAGRSGEFTTARNTAKAFPGATASVTNSNPAEAAGQRARDVERAERGGVRVVSPKASDGAGRITQPNIARTSGERRALEGNPGVSAPANTAKNFTGRDLNGSPAIAPEKAAAQPLQGRTSRVVAPRSTLGPRSSEGIAVPANTTRGNSPTGGREAEDPGARQFKNFAPADGSGARAPSMFNRPSEGAAPKSIVQPRVLAPRSGSQGTTIQPGTDPSSGIPVINRGATRSAPIMRESRGPSMPTKSFAPSAPASRGSAPSAPGPREAPAAPSSSGGGGRGKH